MLKWSVKAIICSNITQFIVIIISYRSRHFTWIVLLPYSNPHIDLCYQYMYRDNNNLLSSDIFLLIYYIHFAAVALAIWTINFRFDRSEHYRIGIPLINHILKKNIIVYLHKKPTCTMGWHRRRSNGKSHLSKLGKLLNNCVDTKMIPINNKSSVNINWAYIQIHMSV